MLVLGSTVLWPLKGFSFLGSGPECSLRPSCSFLYLQSRLFFRIRSLSCPSRGQLRSQWPLSGRIAELQFLVRTCSLSSSPYGQSRSQWPFSGRIVVHFDHNRDLVRSVRSQALCRVSGDLIGDACLHAQMCWITVRFQCGHVTNL